jgi:hypothetical protein
MLKFFCQTYQVVQLPHSYSFISSEKIIFHLSRVVAHIITLPLAVVIAFAGVSFYMSKT